MALDTNQRKEADYFDGVEVEHTAMFGKRTLFVVGIRPIDEIFAYADDAGIKHIYFGTSQSFNPESKKDWEAWDNMIRSFLEKDFWVTLDFDSKYAAEVLDRSWNEFNTFISMISVKLPYLNQFNYHTTIKLDDKTWGYSNPGVWSHRLTSLMAEEKFTGWEEYTGDTPV